MGSKFGVVAPSFFVEKEDNFISGLSLLRQLSYDVVLGDHVLSRHQNTTASAQERASDINKMYADNTVDFIVATDGGSRAIELLPYLDFDLINNHPKPLCGFSDISHLLLAITARTGCITLHGMDIINGFGSRAGIQKETNIDCLFQVLHNSFVEIPQQSPLRILKQGHASGHSVGGWLQSIHNLYGTSYFPNYDDSILFWEAIDTEPHEISMILHDLRIKGCFNSVKGMIIGKLTNCMEVEYSDCFPNIESVILEVTDGYSFPIIANVDFGHGDEHLTLPVGGTIQMDTKAGTIVVNS